MKVDIKNCARCGKNHRGLLFKRFKRILRVNYYDCGVDSYVGFNYWSICPKLNEPILMQVWKN